MDDKTKKKIETMKRAGLILGQVMDEIVDFVKEGVTELDVDKLVERRILELGGEPGFKKVDGYKHTICASTNDVVVHGIPKNRRLVNGDIFGFDCGVYLEGYHTDMAETVRIGPPESSLAQKGGNHELEIMKHDEIDKFLEVGKKTLFKAISEAKPGNRIGHISKAMQEGIEGNGYSIVRSLVGHGVGKELHEEPEIPGYLDGKIDNTPEIYTGMTLAIEAIYNMGEAGVVFEGTDDWTIVSEDQSVAGLFERTIYVSENGPKLITKLKNDPLN